MKKRVFSNEIFDRSAALTPIQIEIDKEISSKKDIAIFFKYEATLNIILYVDLYN